MTTHQRHDSGDAASIARRRAENAERGLSHPYVRYGVGTGTLGAFVVAFTFLIVDVLAGRPLATPTALGATLFFGEPFVLNRTPGALLVLGYTAVHGALFVAMASVASTLLLDAPRPLGLGSGSGSGTRSLGWILFAGFFVTLTAALLCFAAIFDLAIWNELGGVQVSVANLLAAGAMAFALARALRERTQREGPMPARHVHAP